MTTTLLKHLYQNYSATLFDRDGMGEVNLICDIEGIHLSQPTLDWADWDTVMLTWHQVTQLIDIISEPTEGDE